MDVLVWSENRAVAEKKVLMCLLATREAARLGIEITEAKVQSTSDEFRRTFGLEDGDAMADWMKKVELDLESYTQFMRYFAAVNLVQASLGSEIESLLETYQKIQSVRHPEP
jgi:FKBP-type peptidyl-prolyl cis-trans isomerase (trigger factor)